MTNDTVRFAFVEETFKNYESTKKRYPLLPKATLDAITGIVKTVDTREAYEALDSAFKQIKQILPAKNTRADNVPESAQLSFASDSMLARMGAVMLLCSLIENRLRSMYRQRIALINGTHILTAAEEAEIYEQLPNNTQHTHKLRRDVTDAYRVCRFLHMMHDIDTHTFQLLEQSTKIRNALVHDAMFRSTHFTIEVIEFLQKLYTHMQNMRNKMTARLLKERMLYANDDYRDQRLAAQLASITVGALLPRTELYYRLAGSIKFEAPMVNGRFCYIVLPSNAAGISHTLTFDPIRLYDEWKDTVALTNRVVPLFQKTAEQSHDKQKQVVFQGYCRVEHMTIEKSLTKAIVVTRHDT